MASRRDGLIRALMCHARRWRNAAHTHEQDRREYRVGELAAQLGVTPKTVRYYAESGLLPAQRRSSAGYRLYGDPGRESLRFIVKAKLAGSEC